MILQLEIEDDCRHRGVKAILAVQGPKETKRPWQAVGRDFRPQPEDWGEQDVEGQGVKKSVRSDGAGSPAPCNGGEHGLPS